MSVFNKSGNFSLKFHSCPFLFPSTQQIFHFYETTTKKIRALPVVVITHFDDVENLLSPYKNTLIESLTTQRHTGWCFSYKIINLKIMMMTMKQTMNSNEKKTCWLAVVRKLF